MWLLTQEEAAYREPGVERAKCGQAEMDEFDDGGGPRVTGDGPAAQKVPFKSLS